MRTAPAGADEVPRTVARGGAAGQYRVTAEAAALAFESLNPKHPAVGGELERSCKTERPNHTGVIAAVLIVPDIDTARRLPMGCWREISSVVGGSLADAGPLQPELNGELLAVDKRVPEAVVGHCAARL